MPVHCHCDSALRLVRRALAFRAQGERNSVAWKLQRAADADELAVDTQRVTGRA